MNITANEIKTKGVSVFDKALRQSDEAIINVRGKDKFVVLNIERYNEFRASELDVAYMQAMQAINKGDYKVQSAKQHLQDLIDGL
ncbi:HigA protein (antitoxin to HigB) [uncultured Candidatus Thioglobus sp.]|nr:HigA protein (antitoxin to HigB) [uncultured Candidatus Thioglobus sp.]SMM99763.1 HigA protein (antitoxin to HigB) [uncultured Candidatus Thioglobus sp.]